MPPEREHRGGHSCGCGWSVRAASGAGHRSRPGRAAARADPGSRSCRAVGGPGTRRRDSRHRQAVPARRVEAGVEHHGPGVPREGGRWCHEGRCPRRRGHRQRHGQDRGGRCEVACRTLRSGLSREGRSQRDEGRCPRRCGHCGHNSENRCRRCQVHGRPADRPQSPDRPQLDEPCRRSLGAEGRPAGGRGGHSILSKLDRTGDGQCRCERR
mmetsp:Transcript_83370/g.231374  ORF Transcript_83370/g.231374 Transcript_83370/m.231374 type:complete len:212 (+) Transcript_83370:364-999(+)